MKIVSLAIVIIFGGLLIVHYYRQYYNYMNLTKSTKWPCEIDELGKCVKEIELNKCPDYWQFSQEQGKSGKCSNVHKVCPANKPTCRSQKNFQDYELTDGDNVSPETKCTWSTNTGYSWDGVCARAQP